MELSAIIYPLIIMAVLGGVLGLVLAIASKKFYVAVDPRIDAIVEILPGANCGACGCPGCSGYAVAIVEKNVEMNLCAPGGKNVVTKIGEIMGKNVVLSEPVFAFVHCDGDGVKARFRYAGVTTCKAASVMGLAGSFQDCPYGCLGFGSCIEACPFGALSLNQNNIIVVDRKNCAGCAKCLPSCPRKLITLDPESRTVLIRCNNRDKGAKANKQCNHSCIACGKCARICPVEAIAIKDNLAVIDYAKCELCGKCVSECPKHLIVNYKTNVAAPSAL